MSKADGLKKKWREYPYGTIMAIIAVIGGYSFLLLMDHRWSEQNITGCPFKFATGMPCPGCGMGRATLSLFDGNILQSLYYNILCIPFTISVLIGVCWLISDLFKGRDTFFSRVNQPLKRKYTVFLFVVIIVTWVLNIYHRI